jgi:glycosyltransferase involved in cell wall biosynthesis
MDKSSSLLSHQHQAVCALAEKFETVTVITGHVGDIAIPANVRIISTNWELGEKTLSAWRLIKAAAPVIVKGDFGSVFFHMTDLQCAMLSPFIKLRRRRQFLWYAHTHKSIYLNFASKWVDAIVTSTKGSCPIKGGKVISVGQAIDQDVFNVLDFNELDFSKLVHIGRFDKSKKIDELIENAIQIRRDIPEVQLTLVGSPSNLESQIWAGDLVRESRENVHEGWLHFKEAIQRSEFPTEMSHNGVFFHSYQGSLDKTLVESTMLGVPVVTINHEYIKIFGSWSGKDKPNLVEEYKSLRALNSQSLRVEIIRRREIALKHHSLENWINSLASLLQ